MASESAKGWKVLKSQDPLGHTQPLPLCSPKGFALLPVASPQNINVLTGLSSAFKTAF